ncbi:hypothetical protein [Halovalidus salilacus]|uniref:hypothetical protein n=1 Tax=Halovalidus salilacus TaxID=3075124 RepID=UPI00360708A2
MIDADGFLGEAAKIVEGVFGAQKTSANRSSSRGQLYPNISCFLNVITVSHRLAGGVVTGFARDNPSL